MKLQATNLHATNTNSSIPVTAKKNKGQIVPTTIKIAFKGLFTHMHGPLTKFSLSSKLQDKNVNLYLRHITTKRKRKKKIAFLLLQLPPDCLCLTDHAREQLFQTKMTN